MQVLKVFSGVIIISILFFSNCCTVYKGPVSDHFDGKRFFNEEPPNHTFTDMVKWMWEMETVEWPEWIEDPKQPAPVKNADNGQIRVTFINHATILIQMDGLNILTDPIWSIRASPISWAGPKRVRAPGIDMDNLPQIDIILISHDHYDHLDLLTLHKLSKRNNPVMLAGLGVKKLLDSESLTNSVQMDWWQKYALQNSKVIFTFVPAYHDSGRGLFNGSTTLWGGFVIEGPSGRIYYAGDTAFGKFLYKIKEQSDGFRLAIFPIGSYEKRWFMKTQHMNPDDAVRAHILLNAKQSIGMHYATFLEHPEQTIDAHEKDLSEAMAKYQLPENKFWILKFGEGRDVPE